MEPTRVTILGAGPSGLATAFELTDPSKAGEFEVTIYQLGWRNGGHCESGRVPPEYWVNQNGTHYLFGCYGDAMYLLRQAYRVLEEKEDKRFGTFEEQLIERSMVVMKQLWEGEWKDWAIYFPKNDQPLGEQRAQVSTDALVRQAMRIMLGFAVGPAFEQILKGAGLRSQAMRAAMATVRLTAKQLLSLLDAPLGVGWASRQVLRAALEALRFALASVLVPAAALNMEASRAWILLDLGLSIVIGLVVDDALDESMVAKLDDIDLRDWLKKHGATALTVDSPPVNLWYMAMAAYDKGDTSRPICAAGPSVACLLQMVLGYKQAVSFQLLNEVGDSVIGPVTQALIYRGVRFEWFHRVWELEPDGDYVGKVVLEKQVQLKAGVYEPFITPVHGRPVWPDEPKVEFVDKIYVDEKHPELSVSDRRLDNFWCPRSGPDVVLRRGQDYDVLVLALTGATLKWYCKKLAEEREKWAKLTQNLKSVETQGLRIWFLPTLEQTGWSLGPPVLSGYAFPYATWEDPSPVLKSQMWPTDKQPQTVCHLFGPLEFPKAWPNPEDYVQGNAYLAEQRARANVVSEQWMNTQIAALWPNCTLPDNPDGLDLSKCARPPQIRANAGPYEAYLLLEPGTWKARFDQKSTGLIEFYCCGDWTTTHFPCGSIEAAISSGLSCGEYIRADHR